ncbi:MAG: Rieske 2Fe-2S domain-containing protein, partial [Xanthobacteraceae bacterium]|nr:Rieske 2Fe-2S domain-containing protein [Xanthobacteraceae bacterium]
MSAEQAKPKGPDLAQGVVIGDLPDGGMIAGHVGDEAVLLARRGEEFFAIGATCSHYGGPLAEGLMVGETVRCPWHHACFSLRTGEAVAAPAFNPMSSWRVEQRDGRVFVRDKIEAPDQGKRRKPQHEQPERIVIVGGGAAGFAAAEMLRREGFAGELSMISSDDAAPYDRPNCSKDYLAGNAPEDWIPLRPPEFYKDQSINLQLGTHVTGLDVSARQVVLGDGQRLPF